MSTYACLQVVPQLRTALEYLSSVSDILTVLWIGQRATVHVAADTECRVSPRNQLTFGVSCGHVEELPLILEFLSLNDRRHATHEERTGMVASSHRIEIVIVRSVPVRTPFEHGPIIDVGFHRENLRVVLCELLLPKNKYSQAVYVRIQPPVLKRCGRGFQRFLGDIPQGDIADGNAAASGENELEHRSRSGRKAHGERIGERLRLYAEWVFPQTGVAGPGLLAQLQLSCQGEGLVSFGFERGFVSPAILNIQVRLQKSDRPRIWSGIVDPDICGTIMNGESTFGAGMSPEDPACSPPAEIPIRDKRGQVSCAFDTFGLLRRSTFAAPIHTPFGERFAFRSAGWDATCAGEDKKDRESCVAVLDSRS